MQSNQTRARLIFDTIQREGSVAIVVDCVDINLLLDQDLHELLGVVLHCIMERVVA